MEVQTFAEYSHHLQTVAIATIFFAICFFFPKVSFQANMARLPIFHSGESGEKHRKLFLNSAQKLYDESYAKFKNSVYRLVDDDNAEVVIIPPRFLPELRKLSDDVLSFPKAVEKVMEAKYTRLPIEAPAMVHSIKADLTPALTRLNPVIWAEVEHCVSTELPQSEDWTPVNAYSALCTMFAKISGCIFIGSEAYSNPEYIESAIQYTVDLMALQRAVKKIRPWLRPLLAPRLPAYKNLRMREKKAKDLLEPIVAARLEAERNDPNYQRPDDMLAWFMSRSKSYGGHSVADLARVQLGLVFAAIHTTTMITTNTLYTLASTPEYIGTLREEIASVMAANGGTMTTLAIQKMVKLDSYMKETSRFYTTGVASFTRQVMRGFSLSNGQYIPAGVKIQVASHSIHNDPDGFPEGGVPLEQFDPWRFAKLREEGTVAAHARNQFIASNEQSLLFGYGAHACPGRFFASTEMKMVLAKMIMLYDIKNEGDSQERYPNIGVGVQKIVDPTKNILIRKAQT